MSKITEEAIFQVTLGDMVDKTAEGSIEIIVIDMMVTIEVGIDQEKGHSQGFTAVIELEVWSGSRASTNRDRIRCYRCREYDHFARDCPTSREEGDLEQLQQMLNLEEKQTHLLSNIQGSPIDNSRTSPLNL